ncbi:hypothetical protein SDC9_144006 [bioreactor metagenome]|uniref:Sensor histidine kinase NatK-like C-terminal domain-containing protein n=2 Tax=root TaxID=1 RepID=A0A645E5I9_9ZZZZ
MIIAVNICFIVMFRKFETLSAEYAAREEALKRDCTLELLRAELAYCSKTEEASREKWHDLRHHNAVVLEYMNAGETENAKRYLKEYDDGLVAESPTLFCKNPTANAALRIYSRRAKALGAAFSVAADIPEELPVPDPEFGVLLSNLLENACAACENCEAGARFISVLSRTDRGQLLLEIRNRVSGETIFNEGMPRSGKKSGGIGAKSASGIAAKHGGMLRFLREGTEFRVQMVLPLDTQGMHTDEAV